jgi:hypothetical protein
MNSAMTLSMAVFFTIVIVGIQGAFPNAIHDSFAGLGSTQTVPAVQQLASQLAAISPTNALFSAFLGYNPMGTILSMMPASVVSAIPQNVVGMLTSQTWFPQTLQQAFMPALRLSFIIGAVLTAIAAVLSAMRGGKYVHEIHGPGNGVKAAATIKAEEK